MKKGRGGGGPFSLAALGVLRTGEGSAGAGIVGALPRIGVRAPGTGANGSPILQLGALHVLVAHVKGTLLTGRAAVGEDLCLQEGNLFDQKTVWLCRWQCFVSKNLYISEKL